MRLWHWWKLSLFVLSLFSQLHRRLLPGLPRRWLSHEAESLRHAGLDCSKKRAFFFDEARSGQQLPCSCPSFFSLPVVDFLYFSAISATWPNFLCRVMCCSEVLLDLTQCFIIFHERLPVCEAQKRKHTHTYTHIHKTWSCTAALIPLEDMTERAIWGE